MLQKEETGIIIKYGYVEISVNLLCVRFVSKEIFSYDIRLIICDRGIDRNIE